MIKNNILKFYYFFKFLVFRKQTETGNRTCVMCQHSYPDSQNDWCHADDGENGLIYKKVLIHEYYGREMSVSYPRYSTVFRVSSDIVISIKELSKYVVRTGKWSILFMNMENFGIHNGFLNIDMFTPNLNGNCPFYKEREPEKKPEKKTRKK